MSLFETSPDKMRAHLQSLGYTSPIVDALYAHLGTLGYSGSLPDRLYAFLVISGKLGLTLDTFISQLDAGTLFDSTEIGFWDRIDFWNTTNFWGG